MKMDFVGFLEFGQQHSKHESIGVVFFGYKVTYDYTTNFTWIVFWEVVSQYQYDLQNK